MTDGTEFTAEMRAEVARLAEAADVAGHAVFTIDADELAAAGLAEDTVPAAANLIEVAERLAEDLGDAAGCRAILADGARAELSIAPLGEAWRLALRRKGDRP